MLILIHGEDIAAARKKLTEQVSDYQETIYLDGNKIELADIILACETNSLFSLKKAVIVENIFSGQFTKAKLSIFDYLIANPVDHQIVFWQSSIVDKNKINKYLNKAKIFRFDYPQSLFKFLDTIGVATKSQVLYQYHSLLNQQEAEFIFSMIVRQIRFLILVKDAKSNKEMAIPGWQKYKFQSQARFFKIEELFSLYRQLLQIDYRIKTGLTPYKLSQLLDIFLANL